MLIYLPFYILNLHCRYYCFSYDITLYFILSDLKKNARDYGSRVCTNANAKSVMSTLSQYFQSQEAKIIIFSRDHCFMNLPN